MEKNEFELKRQLTEAQTIEMANKLYNHLVSEVEELPGDEYTDLSSEVELELSDGTSLLVRYEGYGENEVVEYSPQTYDYPEYCECEQSFELYDLEVEALAEEVNFLFDKKLVRKICKSS